MQKILSRFHIKKPNAKVLAPDEKSRATAERSACGSRFVISPLRRR